AVRLGLVGGRDLERERLGVPERRPAVEPEARNPQHGELDGQHVPLLPRRVVPRRAVYRADGRIGKGLGVEPRRLLGVAVVPQADRVLRWLRHVTSPWMSRPRVGIDPARRAVGEGNYGRAKRQTT